MKHRQLFSLPEREALPKKVPGIDWNKCFICQEDSAGSLQCPLNAKSCNAKEIYNILAGRIARFQCCKELPVPMNLEILRDGAELAQCLFKHDAKYHKKCYEIFSNAKLDRMEKNGTNIETGKCQTDRPATRLSGNLLME